MSNQNSNSPANQAHNIPDLPEPDNSVPPPTYEEALSSPAVPVDQGTFPSNDNSHPNGTANSHSNHLRPSGPVTQGSGKSSSPNPQISRIQDQSASRLHSPHLGYSPVHSPHSGYSSVQSSYPIRPPYVTPQVPWIYPAGYYCFKCRNSGIKTKNGLQCMDCWRTCAPRSPYLHKSNGMNIRNDTGRPLVLAAGDPRLGNLQCGACRGSGLVDMFLYSDTCWVCGGVGRLNFQ